MAATSQGKNQAPATATAAGPAMTAAGAVMLMMILLKKKLLFSPQEKD